MRENENKDSFSNFNFQSKSRIFNRYRYHVRFAAAPLMLGFTCIDYLYAPQFLLQWGSLRLAFFVYCFASFALLVKYKTLRRHIQWVAVSLVFLAASLINFMILEMSDYQSVYLGGILQCVIFGVLLFKFNKKWTLITEILAYGPTLAILFYTAGLSHWKEAFVQSSVLLGTMVILYVYGDSDEQLQKFFTRFRRRVNTELEHHRRTEILKNHFPQAIRKAIESDLSSFGKKRIFTNAVVGFADIVSSTRIANMMELRRDWELKERFLEAATQRALETNMVVLNHLGDGFLFIANYAEGINWSYNLTAFYENLIRDYEEIWAEMGSNMERVQSGVKFGVSSGPVLVGFIGKNQSYFSAIGPDVNLAARLCSQAQPNEMVVSGRVWSSLEPILQGWETTAQVYGSLKGFSYEVPAVHIGPRFLHHPTRKCSQCEGDLSLRLQEEGAFEFRCAKDHVQILPQNLKIAA